MPNHFRKYSKVHTTKCECLQNGYSDGLHEKGCEQWIEAQRRYRVDQIWHELIGWPDPNPIQRRFMYDNPKLFALRKHAEVMSIMYNEDDGQDAY